MLVTTDGHRVFGVCVCGIASRSVSGMAMMSGMSSGRVSGITIVSNVIWVFWFSVVFCYCWSSSFSVCFGNCGKLLLSKVGVGLSIS